MRALAMVVLSQVMTTLSRQTLTEVALLSLEEINPVQS